MADDTPVTVTAGLNTETVAPAQGSGPAKRIKSLDGLRALAVALVVVHHSLQPHLFGGFVGVDIFFVLSGYLITFIILRQHALGLFSLSRFYWNRTLRLFPALLLAIVICSPVGILMNARRPASVQLADALFAVTYVMNIVENISGEFRWMWSHTWSLAMEEQFYLVWPLIVLLMLHFRVGRRAILALALVSAVSSVALQVLTFDSSVPNFAPLPRMQGLAIGCALALSLESLRARIWLANHLARAAWVGVGVLISAVAIGSLSETWPWVITLASLGAACVIAALSLDDTQSLWLTRRLTWMPAVYVGTISYGIYLWHFPLNHLARLAPEGGVYLWMPISVVASVAIAAASFRWIEKPILRRRSSGANRSA